MGVPLWGAGRGIQACDGSHRLLFDSTGDPMRDLPAEQRPREKLFAKGAAALADSELLSLLLRSLYL